MTAISAFTIPFEGTVGQLVPTPPGGDENPGTGRTRPVYSATSQVGSTSAEWNISPAENTTITFSSSPSSYSLLYVDFYLDVFTLPSASTAIINWESSGVLIGALRIYNPGNPANTFNFQVRSNFTDRWNSVTDAAPDWNLAPGVYRVQLQIQPQVAASPALNGYRLKVFADANLHTDTPSYDSGPISSISANAGTVNQLKFGTVSTVTAGFRIDDVLADDTDPITRVSTATGGHYVKVGGAWELIAGQQYKSGGSWS